MMLSAHGGNSLGKRGLNQPFALSLSKDFWDLLIAIDLIRPWFDKLTTNGFNLRFLSISQIVQNNRYG